MKVRPEALQSYAAWREKMDSAVASFPGFVSMEIFPPGAGSMEWTVIQRFFSEKDVEAWGNSPARKRLLEEVRPFLAEDIKVVKPSDSLAKENVTEVFVTKVSPKMREAYSAWATKVQRIESTFPGYQGVYVQAPPPSDPHGGWITMLRFDTPEHLNNWLQSKERKQILKEAESMVEELQSHQVVSPFAGWFANFANTVGEAPPVWKQTMLVLLVLFPIVMLEMKFLVPLIKNLNPSVGTFIGNAISVSLVSWPMMGLAIRLLGWWLNPKPGQKFRANVLGLLALAGLYLLEIVCLWNLL